MSKHIEIKACMDCPYFREYDNPRSKRKDFYCRLSKLPIILGTKSFITVSQEVPEWCQLDNCSGEASTGINFDPTKVKWIEIKDGLPEMACSCYCEVLGPNGNNSTVVLDYCAQDKQFTYTGNGHVGVLVEDVARYVILPEGKL